MVGVGEALVFFPFLRMEMGLLSLLFSGFGLQEWMSDAFFLGSKGG